MSDNFKLLNNFRIVSKEIDVVQESIKKKYLINKNRLKFLTELQSDTVDKYKQCVRNSQVSVNKLVADT